MFFLSDLRFLYIALEREGLLIIGNAGSFIPRRIQGALVSRDPPRTSAFITELLLRLKICFSSCTGVNYHFT